MKTRLVIALFLAAACSLLAPHPRGQVLAPILFAQSHASFSPQAIDGSATGSGASGANASATLTTTNAGDIIIAATRASSGNTGINPSCSSVSGGSLTWHQRGTTQNYANGAGNSNNQVYWAYAASALSSVSITCTVTGGDGGTATRITVYGVTNTNSTTPFDTNASLPGSEATNSSVTSLANTSGVSTTSANDMLIGYMTVNNALSGLSRPSGWTSIIAAGSVSDFAYEVVSSTVSSQTYTWSWTSSSSPGGLPSMRSNTTRKVGSPLKSLVALVLTALVVFAAPRPHAKLLSGGRAAPGNPVPLGAAAAMVASAGFTKLALLDRFRSLSTIDINNTKAPGFNWYSSMLTQSGQHSCKSTDFSLTNYGLLLDSTNDTGTGYCEGLISEGYVSSPNNVVGHTYGGGGYFEIRYRFTAPSLSQTGWLTDAQQWWGSENGLSPTHWGEIDYAEFYNQSTPSSITQDVDFHDWVNNAVDNSIGGDLSSLDMTQFHVFGCLWQTAAQGGGTGSVTYFVDGVKVTSQGFTYNSGSTNSGFALDSSNLAQFLTTIGGNLEINYVLIYQHP